jgi:hypothetical protein
LAGLQLGGQGGAIGEVLLFGARQIGLPGIAVLGGQGVDAGGVDRLGRRVGPDDGGVAGAA